MEVETARLQVRLLGVPQFEWEQQQVAPASRKGLALLALLAGHEPGLQRDEIAEYLWEPGKLASVRQALYELRKQPGAESWLVEDGTLVRLEAETDLGAFLTALNEDRPAAALAHYGGDFLTGLHDVAVPAFEEWLAFERDRLRALHLSALVADAKQLEAAGEFGAARLRVQDALRIDSLDESLYRTGMRLSYIQGDAVGARELLKRCVAMMQQEFGTEPSPETLELAGAIERGEPLPVSADLSNLPLPRLRILQALAVSVGELGVEGTAKVVERPSFDVAADLGALEASGLVNAHLAVKPSHLAQVLASMPMAVRRLLHERTAEVLLAGGEADESTVARHLLSAGNPAAAAPRFLRAAREAIDRSDLKEAKLLLFRLLWADDGAEAAGVRLEGCLLLEGLASQTGDDPLQDAALQEAERLAWARQSDLHLAEVRMRRSRMQLKRGQRGEALEHALEALEIGTRLKDAHLIARARNALGGAQFYTGDLDGAAESFRANLTAEDPVERFRANNNLGSLEALLGRLQESYEHFNEALTMARAVGSRPEVATTLNNLAATAERMSNYGLAEKHFRAGLDLARRDRARAIEAQLLVNLAVIYKRQGQLGPAWNTVVEVAELAEELDDLRLKAHSLELQAEVKRACGLLTESVGLQEAALAKALELGDSRRSQVLGAQLTVLRCVAGEVELAEAVAVVRELEEEARLLDLTPWLWTELALSAAQPHQVMELLANLDAVVPHRHVRLVADLARVRADLLAGRSEGADTPGSSVAADAVTRLSSVDAAAPSSESASLLALEVMERPHGWWLLLRWTERRGPHAAVPAPSFPAPERVLVTDALQQQAAGLPRHMRESLLKLPQLWAAELEAD